MKRLFSLLLAALALCGAALAEVQPEAPALYNPRTAFFYSDRFDDPDALYAALNSGNDEQAQIEAEGCLTAKSEFMENGEVIAVEYAHLLPGPCGRMLVMRTDRYGFDLALYSSADVTIMNMDGEISLAPEDVGPFREEVDYMWDNYRFPFLPLERFLCHRTDANGLMYILAESSEGWMYEYVTAGEAGNYEMLEIRRYVPDADGGDYVYDLRVTFSSEGVEIPEAALALMMENAQVTADTLEATGNVNLRSLPSLSGEIVAIAEKGARMRYLGETRVDDRGVAWYKAEYKGREGWISSRFARLVW